jgi:uncharacterized OsmC-like protein
MSDTVKEAMEKFRTTLLKNPAGTEAVFTAQTKLVSGVTCQARIREFPPLTVDEPPLMGGNDSGPNPVELVLAALGTCQEIMYGAFAALLGIELSKVEVQAKGILDLKGLLALDGETPAGFSEIRFETRIESPAGEEQIKELAKMVEDHCPILDTLVRPMQVNGKVWHNDLRLKLE